MRPSAFPAADAQLSATNDPVWSAVGHFLPISAKSAAELQIADIDNRPGEPVGARSVDGCLWDIASFAWIRVRSAGDADKSFEADVSPALEDFGS